MFIKIMNKWQAFWDNKKRKKKEFELFLWWLECFSKRWKFKTFFY